MADFVKGDTVKLKSGGPMMTVTSVGENNIHGLQVWTVWFDGKKKMDDSFAPETLKKVNVGTGRVSVGRLA